MKTTHENYLKAIYHLSPSETYLVATSAIAEQLTLSKSSATEVAQELAVEGFVDYHRYQGVRLTAKGKKKALQIIRSHRLWEVFLVEKLGFNWDEVHELAEELEHIRNEKFIDSLEAFLAYPKRDPHGDPIPTKSGKLPLTPLRTLSDMKVGERGVLTQVEVDSEEFLQLLDKKKIAIGALIEVCSIESFDDSISIQLDHRIVHLSNKAASYLKLANEY